jgi:hypothetical protein
MLLAAAWAVAVGFSAGISRADQATPAASPTVHSPVPSLAAPSSSPAAPGSPSPSPQPSSTSLSLGALTIDGVASGFAAYTSGTNPSGSFDTATGADRASRYELSNAFLIVNKDAGVFRYGFAAGVYNIPVVGFALNPTLQNGANTSLYTALPSVYAMYAPTGSFNIEAGKLATFTGQESTYTYENPTIERGIIWNMETAVSRALRINLTGSKFNGGLEVDDGFYSGNRLGVQGQLTNTPTSNLTLEFVFVMPNPNAPGNPTSSIANKRLFNPLLTYTNGKWTFSPYLLWVQSPAVSALGYTRSENAFGAVLNASYAMNPEWNLAGRVEYGKNGSSMSDLSANANLLGYGPGSDAWTYTLTPAYRKGIFFARIDLSQANVNGFSPGLGFGAAGTQHAQFRTVFETGLQF